MRKYRYTSGNSFKLRYSSLCVLRVGRGDLRVIGPLSGELLGNALEHLLNRRRVADEAHGHLQSLRRDVADATLHVVRNPLNEVRRILVLHVEHLLINLLRRHAATEETRRRQVAAVTSCVFNDCTR